MNTGRFAGKVVVITGGASGIGKATALAFAAEGASLAIADIQDSRLTEAENELRGKTAGVLAVHCDVSRDEDVDALAAQVIERFGRVDILMNNAGVMLRGPMEKMPTAEWEWILSINFLGAVRGVRAFAPHMIEQGNGHIINTASIGGLLGGRPHSAGYSASKFALVGYSETLYVHLQSKGIDVSVLCPGGVHTNLPEQFRLSSAAESAEGYGMDETFGAEAATPEAVAALVLHAVEERRFMIFTDPRHQKILERRVGDIQAWVEQRARMGS